MGMDTTTGLVEEFVFTIKDAHFGVDARINDGKSILLQMSGINSETAAEDSIWLKVGNTWEISDGGKTLSYTGSGKTKAINKATAYGKWIDSFVALDGAQDIITEQDMDALRADSWIGLSLLVARREQPFVIDGQQVTQKYFEVLGIEGLTIPDAADDTPEIPEGKLAALTKLAGSTATFEQFVDAAYEQVEGLTGASFEDYVTDASDTGFYATHKG